MKNLVSYSMFEKATPMSLNKPNDSRLSTPGTLSKIDVDSIGNNNPAIKNATSNWFERLGKGIEGLGGDLIQNPDSWKANYKAGLMKNRYKSATGEKSVTVDSGFSDLLAGGVSLIKGLLGKVFGSPETIGTDTKGNPELTQEHQRLFLDKNGDKIRSFQNEEDLNKWAKGIYSETNLKPGQNESVDKVMGKSYTEWLGTPQAKGSLEGVLKGASEVEAIAPEVAAII